MKIIVFIDSFNVFIFFLYLFYIYFIFFYILLERGAHFSKTCVLQGPYVKFCLKVMKTHSVFTLFVLILNKPILRSAIQTRTGRFWIRIAIRIWYNTVRGPPDWNWTFLNKDCNKNLVQNWSGDQRPNQAASIIPWKTKRPLSYHEKTKPHLSSTPWPGSGGWGGVFWMWGRWVVGVGQGERGRRR